jgi:hypothetical protein
LNFQEDYGNIGGPEVKQFFYEHILPHLSESNFGMSEKQIQSMVKLVTSLAQKENESPAEEPPKKSEQTSGLSSDVVKEPTPALPKKKYNFAIADSDIELTDDLHEVDQSDFCENLQFTSTQIWDIAVPISPPKTTAKQPPKLREKIIDYNRLDKKGRPFVQFRYSFEMASSGSEDENETERKTAEPKKKTVEAENMHHV